MLTRVATRVVQVVELGAIALGGLLLVAGTATQRHEPIPPRPLRTGCGGWTAVQLPALQLVDVAAPSPDAVWLLTKRGVYHWDGCTWRTHAPFTNLAGTIVDWETIVVDPDGALVVTGESPPGPTVYHGCVGTPMFEARRRSYRFSPGQSTWEPIEPRPPAKPEIDTDNATLDTERRIIATSGHDITFAIVERTRHIGVPDVDGIVRGWGTTTSTELWREVGGAWSSVLAPPEPRRSRNDRAPTIEGPSYIRVEAIGGSGPRELWAVGYRSDVMPDIVHFDGHAWTSHRGRFRSDIQYHLGGVASTGPDDAWVIGSWGTVLHWDGASWTELDKPSFVDLVEVTALPGFVLVRDDGGGIFYRTY